MRQATLSPSDKQPSPRLSGLISVASVVLVALLATFSLSQAAAQGFNSSKSGIYRWTDQDGKVHFGEKPPRDQSQIRELKEVKTRNTASSDQAAALEARQQRIEAQRNPGNASTSEAYDPEQKAKIDEINRENCKTAKANVSRLQNGGRISMTNESGERYFLTDEQISQELKKNQTYQSENCN